MQTNKMRKKTGDNQRKKIGTLKFIKSGTSGSRREQEAVG